MTMPPPKSTLHDCDLEFVLTWEGGERSSVELPSQGASPDVLPVSKVGAILTPPVSSMLVR